MEKPRIILAHDYLTQRGGAERVALVLGQIIDPEYLITSLYSPGQTYSEFKSFDVRASFLNRISFFRNDPRRALPLLALIWGVRRPIDADAVVCSSSGWAHGLPVTQGTRKIVYCHNPARWLYQTADYLMGQPFHVRIFAALLRPFLLWWDQKASASVDTYIANSTSVAGRIRSAYGKEPIIVFPPVSLDVSGALDELEEIAPNYFLTIGRARGYKGTQILIEAFRSLSELRLVIVGSEPSDDYPQNVTALGHVSDAQLRWLYSNARALISVSREDFGLTPIEANAFGTPVLLLRAGGFLDTTVEGVTGLFIEDPNVESIVKAVSSFPAKWNRDLICRHADKYSPDKFRDKIFEIIATAIDG